jgi:hypothetical protein
VSASMTLEKPASPASAGKPSGRPAKMPGGRDLGKDRSATAQRLAAVILEVLAGARTPAQAAAAIGLTVPRYYQVEAQALRGLLKACEPKPKGRQPNAASEASALRQENQRLQREVTRQQTLVRAAQRAVGLAPPAPMPKTKAGKKTRKRRVARALTVAARLHKDNASASAPSQAAAPASA